MQALGDCLQCRLLVRTPEPVAKNEQARAASDRAEVAGDLLAGWCGDGDVLHATAIIAANAG